MGKLVGPRSEIPEIKNGQLPNDFTYEDARRKLTPRQKVFCEFIMMGQTPEEALKNAGWKPRDDREASHIAATVIKRPAVMRALTAGKAEDILEKMRLATAWSGDWWRTELFRTMRAAIEADDIPSRTRILEIAGKHLGLLDSKEQGQAAEQTARLMQGLADLMAAQMLAQSNAPPDAIKTIEGRVREALGIPSSI